MEEGGKGRTGDVSRDGGPDAADPREGAEEDCEPEYLPQGICESPSEEGLSIIRSARARNGGARNEQ